MNNACADNVVMADHQASVTSKAKDCATENAPLNTSANNNNKSK